jgi:hypothetical protein
LPHLLRHGLQWDGRRSWVLVSGLLCGRSPAENDQNPELHNGKAYRNPPPTGDAPSTVSCSNQERQGERDMAVKKKAAKKKNGGGGIGPKKATKKKAKK